MVEYVSASSRTDVTRPPCTMLTSALQTQICGGKRAIFRQFTIPARSAMVDIDSCKELCFASLDAADGQSSYFLHCLKNQILELNIGSSTRKQSSRLIVKEIGTRRSRKFKVSVYFHLTPPKIPYTYPIIRFRRAQQVFCASPCAQTRPCNFRV